MASVFLNLKAEQTLVFSSHLLATVFPSLPSYKPSNLRGRAQYSQCRCRQSTLMFYILTAADIHSTPQSSLSTTQRSTSQPLLPVCAIFRPLCFTFHYYFVSVNAEAACEGRYLAGLAAEICHGVC